jgi:hypothetical protein
MKYEITIKDWDDDVDIFRYNTDHLNPESLAQSVLYNSKDARQAKEVEADTK